MGGSRLTKFLAEFFAAEIRAWRGEQPLWKVFWRYGVVTSGALIAFYVIGFYVDRIALRQVLVFCFALYTVWILVSVWRCANNTRERLWGSASTLVNCGLGLQYNSGSLIRPNQSHHEIPSTLRRMRLPKYNATDEIELRH